MEPFQLLDFSSDPLPIFEQLQLEEALLRTDDRNWMILNRGDEPTIVLGISGKPDELVQIDAAASRNVPLVRRFSGGGTVITDENTLFVTLIGNHAFLPVQPFPARIMGWTEQLYRPLFGDHPFRLRDNDYCLGDRKVGGNAQSLTKNRWLHHTTFLWDYDPHLMDLLTLPKRVPPYRQGRSHKEFLTTLSGIFPDARVFFDSLSRENEMADIDFEEILLRPHRRMTMKLKVSAIKGSSKECFSTT
jgi:lipoate-protein ligase A